jgi:hypothetical protein
MKRCRRRQIRAARGSSCVESKTAESTKAGLLDLDGPAKRATVAPRGIESLAAECVFSFCPHVLGLGFGFHKLGR